MPSVTLSKVVGGDKIDDDEESKYFEVGEERWELLTPK
jgi:hypothetical protein